MSRPSWNPGDRPAPWWTRQRPRTARLASDSARTNRRRHIRTCTGCVAEGFRFWSLRDRSCPWRARRRPGSRHVLPRGRHALRRPWRSQFVTRRARGGGRWRTPPRQPPRTRAPWSKSSESAACSNLAAANKRSQEAPQSAHSAQVTQAPAAAAAVRPYDRLP